MTDLLVCLECLEELPILGSPQIDGMIVWSRQHVLAVKLNICDITRMMATQRAIFLTLLNIIQTNNLISTTRSQEMASNGYSTDATSMSRNNEYRFQFDLGFLLYGSVSTLANISACLLPLHSTVHWYRTKGARRYQQRYENLPRCRVKHWWVTRMSRWMMSSLFPKFVSLLLEIHSCRQFLLSFWCLYPWLMFGMLCDL